MDKLVGFLVRCYLPADDLYPLDESTTVLDASTSVFDHANSLKAGMDFYIYENWPEMDLTEAYPPTVPTTTEILAYHNETTGSFHDWWLDYQDLLLANRSEYNVRLIPVGSIISKILRDEIPQIPFNEIYEDSAPHGKSSLYFLAGLICCMGIYAEKAPASYSVPGIVHPLIQNNYQSLVDFIWSELISFNLPNGQSRVFPDAITSSPQISVDDESILVYPNPTSDEFTIIGNLSNYTIDILDINGVVYQNLNSSSDTISININELPNGLYFIQVQNVTNGDISIRKILRSD